MSELTAKARERQIVIQLKTLNPFFKNQNGSSHG
jgi:hypothetical protein